MNFLDLFAGAGGLSEGFVKAGFDPIAHVEIDKYASMTLETRAAYYYLKEQDKLEIYRQYQKTYLLTDKERKLAREEFLKTIPQEILDSVINKGIADDTIDDIFKQVDQQMNIKNIDKVDLIVGGPPCQAYSVIGRSRDADRKANDPRNYLYQLYVKFLDKYKPKAFVFENVPGIYTAQNGSIYKDLIETLDKAGYVTKTNNLNSKDFGVLQNRKRVIIIGWRKDLSYNDFSNIYMSQSVSLINDILVDLPKLKAGDKYTSTSYKGENNETLKELGLRSEDDIVTHHVARMHNERDLEIYKRAVKLWNDKKRRLKYSDLPDRLITHKNLKSFLDRFKVVAGDLDHSHTVVAHIAKDGHHYIHPDVSQNRSLTIREAARIQSFPDNYFFEGPRTANFTQIGNAVPPFMAEQIAKWIKSELKE